MSLARANQTSTLLNDGTVLVAGGLSFVQPLGGGSPTADVFDPTIDMFTPTGPMGTARFLHTATRLNNNQVLITGGQITITVPNVFASSAELYK